MATLTAEQLRQRCEEARKIAEEMKDPFSRHTMMGISLSYDRLALRALIDERLRVGAQRGNGRLRRAVPQGYTP